MVQDVQVDEVVARLREFEHLRDCTEDELAELAQRCEEVRVPAGWAFIIEGTPGDSCFLVLEGEVSVIIAGQQIRRIGPGRLVGEIALLEQRPRTATCSAITPLRLLEMSASEFNHWLQQRPRIRNSVLAAATQRSELRY